MSTKTTGRATATSLLMLSALLVIGSVGLAVAAGRVSYGVIRLRESTCNGRIPMPTSAFALGWAAVAVALLATMAVLVSRRLRDPVSSSDTLYDIMRALLGVGAAVALLVGIASGTLLLVGAGAIVLAGAVVALIVVRRRCHAALSVTSGTQHPEAPRSLFMALLMAAVLALLLDGYGLSIIYGEAPTKAHVCFG